MFDFRIVPKIIFGRGSIGKAAGEIEALGGSRILIVTDKGLVKTNLIKKIIESIKDFDLTLYEDVTPNPKDTDVVGGLNILKEKNCDLVLGIGGGSPMDVAKIIAAMATNPGNLWEYRGVDKFKYPPLPLILIPTTAGTGSEVSRAAMITDSREKRKTLFLSWHLSANTAILDPELTLKLPPTITMWSGMDALSHAVESYVSKMANTLTDIYAEKAIALIAANIEKTVTEGDDIGARSNMLLGSLLAGIATANARLGNVHGMAHAIGGQYDLPHGLLCGALLPTVMWHNLEYCTEKLRKIATILDEDAKSLPKKKGAERAVELIKELCKRLGLPEKLEKIGLKNEDIPELVEKTDIIPTNPRPTNKEDLFALYRMAITGST
ncbi:MAG: iron-containing alcohol dehydrogenase family protein [Candidatus Hadarchaeaceae archaeon]